MADKMADALRQFAASKAAQKEPPKQDSLGEKNITPQTHLRVAWANLEEFEQKIGGVRDILDTSPLFALVSRAARHIADARAMDPTATMEIDGKSEPITVTQDFLSAQALDKEGLLHLVSAKLLRDRRSTDDKVRRSRHGRELDEDIAKESAEAITCWNKATRYVNSARYYRYLAEVHLLRGEHEQASKAINHAIKLEPANVEFIRYRDENAGDLAGYQPPKPRMQITIPYYGWTALAGIICGLLGFAATADSRIGFFIAAAALLAFSYWRWNKASAAHFQSYKAFAEAQAMYVEDEVKEGLHRQYSERYHQERRDGIK